MSILPPLIRQETCERVLIWISASIAESNSSSHRQQAATMKVTLASGVYAGPRTIVAGRAVAAIVAPNKGHWLAVIVVSRTTPTA